MEHKKSSIETVKAYSLIITVSEGCSYGECSFCSAGDLKIRSLEDILEDLAIARESYSRVNKIFIVDGDSLTMDTEDIIKVLAAIEILFPEVLEVSIYASALSVLGKDIEELRDLKEAGLTNIYMGIESGNDEVLARVKKGLSSEELLLAARKVSYVGLRLFTRVIIGLAGLGASREHAGDTARLLNRIRPDKIVLEGIPMEGDFLISNEEGGQSLKLLTPRENLGEIRELIGLLDFDRESIIETRMSLDGVSIYGKLPGDKKKILEMLDREIDDIGYKEYGSSRI